MSHLQRGDWLWGILERERERGCGQERETDRERERETWHGLISLQPECQLRNVAVVPGSGHFDFDLERHTQSYLPIKI